MYSEQQRIAKFSRGPQGSGPCGSRPNRSFHVEASRVDRHDQFVGLPGSFFRPGRGRDGGADPRGVTDRHGRRPGRPCRGGADHGGGSVRHPGRGLGGPICPVPGHPALGRPARMRPPDPGAQTEPASLVDHAACLHSWRGHQRWIALRHRPAGRSQAAGSSLGETAAETGKTPGNRGELSQVRRLGAAVRPASCPASAALSSSRRESCGFRWPAF